MSRNFQCASLMIVGTVILAFCLIPFRSADTKNFKDQLPQLVEAFDASDFPLLLLALEGKNEQVRQYALELLEKSEFDVKQLSLANQAKYHIHLARDGELFLLGEAAFYELVAALDSVHPSVQLTALRNIALARNSADSSLLRAVRGSSDLDESTFGKAVMTASRKVLQMVDHPDADFREAAIKALYELKETKNELVMSRLLAALEDVDPKVRLASCEALAKLKNPDAFDSLVEFTSDPEIEIRARAAGALGHLGDPRGIPRLIQLINDDQKRVANSAVAALSQVRDSRAIEPLFQLLFAKRSHAAASALAIIGFPPRKYEEVSFPTMAIKIDCEGRPIYSSMIVYDLVRIIRHLGLGLASETTDSTTCLHLKMKFSSLDGTYDLLGVVRDVGAVSSFEISLSDSSDEIIYQDAFSGTKSPPVSISWQGSEGDRPADPAEIFRRSRFSDAFNDSNYYSHLVDACSRILPVSEQQKKRLKRELMAVDK